MMFEKERYKVSNKEGTVSVYVSATNLFEALLKAKELTECDDFKIVERIEKQ